MTVFVVDDFRRWMRRQVLRDGDLCDAVAEMTRGLIDADLGHGLLKKRVARSGAGKRGGYRVIVASRRSAPWFFLRGYAKSDQGNVSPLELGVLKTRSKRFLSMSEEDLRCARARGEVMEVSCDVEKEIEDRL